MSWALRSLAARCRPPPALARPGPRAALSTRAVPPPPRRPTTTHAPTTTTTRARLALGAGGPLAAARRHLASGAAAPRPPSALDWNSFFKLRLRRRRVQIAFSAVGGVLGAGAGGALLSTGLAEPLVVQVPLDPFISLGLMTLACAAMGWLVGPSLGSQAFYLVNRRLKPQMMAKEAEFFARVRKHRVDPSNSSAGNPGAYPSPCPPTPRAVCRDALPLTHSPPLLQCPTFTAKKSRASRATAAGSRTNVPSTRRRRPILSSGRRSPASPRGPSKTTCCLIMAPRATAARDKGERKGSIIHVTYPANVCRLDQAGRFLFSS